MTGWMFVPNRHKNVKSVIILMVPKFFQICSNRSFLLWRKSNPLTFKPKDTINYTYKAHCAFYLHRA